MLIGMNGKKQAGKDTAYMRLLYLYGTGDSAVLVERRSFADKLYESTARALGCSIAELYEWKLDPNIRIEVYRYQAKKQAVRGGRRIRVLGDFRGLLQRYGTEAHREIFDDDFWVKAVDLTTESDDDIVVVTDVRFPNEAQAIKDAGGYVVRLVGPPEIEDAGDAHASEVPLEDELVDFTIDNSHRDDGFAELDDQLLIAIGKMRSA